MMDSFQFAAASQDAMRLLQTATDECRRRYLEEAAALTNHERERATAFLSAEGPVATREALAKTATVRATQVARNRSCTVEER